MKLISYSQTWLSFIAKRAAHLLDEKYIIQPTRLSFTARHAAHLLDENSWAALGVKRIIFLLRLSSFEKKSILFTPSPSLNTASQAYSFTFSLGIWLYLHWRDCLQHIHPAKTQRINFVKAPKKAKNFHSLRLTPVGYPPNNATQRENSLNSLSRICLHWTIKCSLEEAVEM